MKEKLLTFLKKAHADSNYTLVEKDIQKYVEKLLESATIITVSSQQQLQAFIAYYDNNQETKEAFLSMIVVGKELRGRAYGKRLIFFAEDNLRRQGFERFTLEVKKTNLVALKLYRNLNFEMTEERDNSLILSKRL